MRFNGILAALESLILKQIPLSGVCRVMAAVVQLNGKQNAEIFIADDKVYMFLRNFSEILEEIVFIRHLH